MNQHENDSNTQNNQYQTVKTIRPMPHGMKIIVSVIMFTLSIYFTLTVADMFYSEMLIKISNEKTSATVTQKIITKNKHGKKYYINYTFKTGDKEQRRKRLFGLVNRKSQLSKQEFEFLNEGGKVAVVFSKIKPQYNRMESDAHRFDDLIFYMLGILIFGVISINEFRNMIFKKNR